MEAIQIACAVLLVPFWVGALSQLVGMPVAWLRLRRLRTWAERPPGVRRIELLAAYARPVTEIAAAAAFVLAALVALILIALQPESTTFGWVAFAFVYGAPLVPVPWAVARLDPAQLAELDLYKRKYQPS